MRILMVTASFPYPPASGGAIRTYGMLRGLHKAGHELFLLSFHDGATPPGQTPLAVYCHRIETVLPPVRATSDRLREFFFTSQADMENRLFSTTFRDRLLKLVREVDFDLIQFEGLEVAGYLPLVRQAGVRAKLCYDAFNAEADLQRTMYHIDRLTPSRIPAALYSLVQSRRIEQFEKEVCTAANLVIAVSPEDAALLREHRPDKRVAVVPSGLYVDDYSTNLTMTDEVSLNRPDMGKAVFLPERSLVFTGKMDYRPNIDAMLWFSNQILVQVPDTTLIIVGQQPAERVQQLMRRSNIRLTGYVDSVQPFLRACDVFVAPLRMGSGTRLKILEAMACGCAIVATSLAASGLSPEAKQTMLIADTEQAFADAVNRLLNNAELRKTLGKQAFKTVGAYYDWSVIIPRLLEVYKGVPGATGD